DCEYDQRKRVREYGCADRDDDRLEPKYTQPLDDWNAQQRMGCEERSDDDRRNEGIAKTEAEQGSEEQRHDSGIRGRRSIALAPCGTGLYRSRARPRTSTAVSPTLRRNPQSAGAHRKNRA